MYLTNMKTMYTITVLTHRMFASLILQLLCFYEDGLLVKVTPVYLCSFGIFPSYSLGSSPSSEKAKKEAQSVADVSCQVLTCS